MSVLDKFNLNDKVTIITGGAGSLGVKHAEAIAEAGGTPVLWDIDKKRVTECAERISRTYKINCLGLIVDITQPVSVIDGFERVLNEYKGVDILINNAANNPKVVPGETLIQNRMKNFPLDLWKDDIAVGLTGAFLCSQTIGSYMAENKGGVILNVASDLGVIAPDQRIYRKEGLKEDEQPVKPVTYSVIKHGLIGMTKYLATYWADKNIRVNSISPGGIYTNQPEEFVKKLSNLIPLNRMAGMDEYRAAVLFLVSEASSYMTGANLVIDGGRTCW